MRTKFYQNEYGAKLWCVGAINHRTGGPSSIRGYTHTQSRLYYFNNHIHRVDGPALIDIDSVEENHEWYICGNEITKQLYRYCKVNDIDINNYQNLSISDKLKLKFKFGLIL